MKFNKYQLVAAGIVLAIIVIVVFTQRSDWDANKYILSADDAGNLEPKSEKYFDDKEKALIAAVDRKIAAVDNKVNIQRRDFNNRAGHVDRHFATKGEFNRLDAWSRTVGPWADARYQPKGNYQAAGHYVQYNRPFHLKNKARGNELFGEWRERGGWYGGDNGNTTRWYIS